MTDDARPQPAEPPAEAAAAPRRRGCGWYALWGCSAVVLVAGLTVGAAHLLALRSYGKALAAARERIRAEGYPADFDELERWHRAMPEGDARPELVALLADVDRLYIDPFKELGREDTFPKVLREGEAPVPGDLPVRLRPAVTKEEAKQFYWMCGVGVPLRGRMSPEGRALLAELVAKRRGELDILHSASKVTLPCRVPFDYSEPSAGGWTSPFADLLATRLLKAEAMLRAEEGRMDEAVECVAAVFGIQRCLRAEPSSLWHRNACFWMTIDGLERMMAVGGLTDGHLARLSQAAARAELADCLLHVLIGLRCRHLRRYDSPADSFLDEDDDFAVKAGLFIDMLKGKPREALREYVAAAEEMISAAKSPHETRTGAVGAVAKSIEARRPKSGIRWMRRGPFRMLKVLVYEAESYVQERALLRVMRAAVAVERYRLAEGKLPGKLSELVPKYLKAVPLDPFDGKPIRCMFSGGGCTVYSIGKDDKNNGGDPGEDITFTIRSGTLTAGPDTEGSAEE